MRRFLTFLTFLTLLFLLTFASLPGFASRLEAQGVRAFPSSPSAGDRTVLTAGGVEFAFRWCPAGEFMMGGEAFFDEKPIRQVRLTRGFWLLETEVTQAMWESVMGENPSWFKGERRPVERVSWTDCQEFCRKLSERLGLRVQLPTEAQWEYACRAGTTGDHAGDPDLTAWYRENSGWTTHDAGQKRPNAWGLFDMHGNVWEWCADYWDESYYATAPMIDPENATAEHSSFFPYRVNRGGGWFNCAAGCRSADRFWLSEIYRANFLGFRVLVAEQTPDSQTPDSQTPDSQTADSQVTDAQAPDSPASDAQTQAPQSPASIFPQSPASAQSLPSSPRAGDRAVLTAGGVEFAFRWCPAGEFMMGSPEDEQGRYGDEKQHRVRLTRGFWLLETEVTQVMWESVMGENPSWFKGERRPVERVSWTDCQEFCRKLSERLGLRVQLPTEAQWEYACRAGTTGAYAGDLDFMGWYDFNSYDETHDAGQKRPNAWGLFDMHGNVWEWCADYWDAEYYGRSPENDPENTTPSPLRMARGGGWFITSWYCRSAYRRRHDPDFRYYVLGLRVLLVPNQEASRRRDG